MEKTVLILGASGKIGRHSSAAFTAAGWTVRHYDRASGDMTGAAMGCDVIVNGLNPPNYKNWAVTIPAITREVLAAAKASGATVILPGNVYHFGDQGGVWSEKTPPRPVSRKGKIRLDMEEAYRKSGVQTIVLRAGNFIDPQKEDDVMSLVYLRNISKGRVILPGPAETQQAMCYLPDWARAAVALAEMRGALAPFEDVPFPGHTMSGADIRAHAEAILGRKVTFEGFPWWIMRLSAPFWELARELLEMRYLWATDHRLSEVRFNDLLPDFKATALEDVMKAALLNVDAA